LAKEGRFKMNEVLKEGLRITKTKDLIEKVESMRLKNFFWRKSAIVGIVWGLLSLILGSWYGGSPFPLSHFWHWSLLAQVQYILFFPFHAIALIFPEHLNISSTLISHVHTLSLILTPLLIGMIICVSLDNIISKIIKKVFQKEKGRRFK
jgi:hypothetical protein